MGGAGALLRPRPVRAGDTTVAAADRKFVFVLAVGGWDPTRVLADGFDHSIVDMEATAQRATTGGLTWVDNASRPSVRAFFEQYSDRTAIVRGMEVPSIAHEACFTLCLTGSTADTGSDWPSILGGAQFDRYVAPTLVLGGPYFPGVNLASVVQTGGKGQLTDLIDGGYDAWSGSGGVPLSLPSDQVVDAYVAGRGRAYAAGARSQVRKGLASAFDVAEVQMSGLQGLRHQLSFSDFSDLSDAFHVTADALHQGLSRCVVVSAPVSGDRQWDSHVTNDDMQDFLFEDLYGNLLTLLFLLETLPGTRAATLLEETTIIVYSEMGRTPWLNEAGGKDHWPYTSAMLVGSGIRGGVTVGAYDDSWYGTAIDPDTGLESTDGVPMTCGALGATLLALGDVDPAEHVEPAAIPALMA